MKIACPKCDWEPDGGPHWSCSCGYHWNTFDTVGKCPQCGKQWNDTQCPGPGYPGGCGGWSPHLDWYRNLGSQLQVDLKEIERVKAF